MTTSKASAAWQGGLKTGKGEFRAASGAFSGAYTFSTRFEGATGTTPEELMAAAHAACFSMALAGLLEREGTPPTTIETTAECTIDKAEGGFRITTMKLATRGTVPGIDGKAFAEAAKSAKQGCPVSQALDGNVEVSVDARLA